MDYEDEDGLSKLLNMDMSGLSFDGVDLSALEGMDLSGLNNLDLSGLLDVDMSGLSFADSLDDMDTRMGDANSGVIVGDAEGGGRNRSLFGSDTKDTGGSSAENLSGLLGVDMSGLNTGPVLSGESEYGTNLNRENLEDRNFDADKASQAEYQRYLNSLENQEAGLEFGGGTGAQDYGASTDVDKSQSDMADRGGKLPSGWQKSSDGSYVNIREDGTANGIDQDGNSFTLSESQVQARIKSGDLNTFKSGYNTATGGTKIAPGGGSPVTLKNGKEGQLMPDGKVIDKDTGKVIGTDKDVKTGTAPKSGSGDKSGTGDKKNDLSYLLPLLLAMMAMNRGGGSSSGAVIPSLSADRKQLPYGPSSGEVKRPGAGGTTYFSPTTYTKKAAGGGMMYGGGGISNLGGYSDGGRLLRGPGDGVSDSIPATIGGKQPARLATGEFVVPARIVSELGNGSTEAGAKKLYAMMDRVQKARRKTKNVAADTKAHKYLPA